MAKKATGFQSLGVLTGNVARKRPRIYPHWVDSRYTETRNALVARRQAIAEEIGRHPRPITACDVHFNRLLEERAALSEEIARLETLEDRGDTLPAADAHGD